MRFMMLMIPEVYRKPTPPDFMPDMEAVKKMGKYNEELETSYFRRLANQHRKSRETVRPLITTSAPSRAKPSATAKPIPAVEPDTNARLPLSFRSMQHPH